MCTHCQHSTEWMITARDSRGCLGQPINGFVMNSFAYVQQVSQPWREKLEKLNYGTNSYIGINERRCTSWQNHLKMWCIYWVMSFKHWKHFSACEDHMHIRLLPDYSMLNWCDSFSGAMVIGYRYAQEKDSKWEQMIYLWRGLTLKQILENECIGHPLTKTQLMMCQAATIMASFWFSRNFWSLVSIFFFLALFTLLVIWLFRL